jgi:hypothetical protein
MGSQTLSEKIYWAGKTGGDDPAEINTLEGVTASATELNILDGALLSTEELNILNGVTATAFEINNVADVSARVQEMTVSGPITAGVQSVELNHETVPIAATMVATASPGLFVIKDTSASGTAAHTVTLTGGTFNGTATVATLNARDEMLVVYFDSAGRGQVIANIGAVALS